MGSTTEDGDAAVKASELPVLESTDRRADEVASAVTSQTAGPTSSRLVSLDAFRGLTILGMLIVNNTAFDVSTPRHLKHAAWNAGVHAADLVFPWFLFIVGVAIPFAAASRLAKGLPFRAYLGKAICRAMVLVLLGCLIDSSVARTPVFGLGVLQLIGLAYLAAAALYGLPLAWRAVIAMTLLVAHWALIRFLPIPGVGAGVFTESVNAVEYLNRTYLQTLHLRGLVSVVPTSALAIIGSMIGDLLRSHMVGDNRKVWLMLGAGAVLTGAGLLWDRDLPFNKPLWTASYILYCAGWAAATLGVFYHVIDVHRIRAWSFPLVVFGMNAIVGYVAPILVKVYIIQGWTWAGPGGSSVPLQQFLLDYLRIHEGAALGGWIYTMSYVLFWWLVLLWMYERKTFVRV